MLQPISEQLEVNGQTLSPEDARQLEDRYHVAFGAVIVNKWQMPVIVQEAVQYYQDYQQARRHKDQAMVIHAADKLAEDTLACQKQGICKLESVLDDDVFAGLNLYQDEIERLKEQSEKVLAGMEAMRA